MQLGIEPLEELLPRGRVAFFRGGEERGQIEFHVVRPRMGSTPREPKSICPAAQVSCQETQPTGGMYGECYGSEIAASNPGRAITAAPSTISATPATFAATRPYFQFFSTTISAKIAAIHNKFI